MLAIHLIAWGIFLAPATFFLWQALRNAPLCDDEGYPITNDKYLDGYPRQ